MDDIFVSRENPNAAPALSVIYANLRRKLSEQSLSGGWYWKCRVRRYCDQYDEFLAEHGVEKGIMQLVDQTRAEALFAAMDSRTDAPGGSVANTIAGLGSLGLRTAFIGRVADDDLGLSYALAMQAEGTDFPNPPVRNADLPTSRSMYFRIARW